MGVNGGESDHHHQLLTTTTTTTTSYHQKGPLGNIISEWDYSHPPLEEMLARGYRELEIDIHWSADQQFRVFHLKVRY